MKIKQVNMTNVEFIKKWLETDHEMVTEIDEAFEHNLQLKEMLTIEVNRTI